MKRFHALAASKRAEVSLLRVSKFAAVEGSQQLVLFHDSSSSIILERLHPALSGGHQAVHAILVGLHTPRGADSSRPGILFYGLQADANELLLFGSNRDRACRERKACGPTLTLIHR